MSAWTGYSFVAITQVRRPRLLDSVNVFGLAIGILLLNTTIGAPHHWFFFAFGLYMMLAAYAVVYNIKMLADAMPFRMVFSDWAPCVWGTVLYVPPALLAGWLSLNGTLTGSFELAIALVAMTQPLLWSMSFYKMWKRAIVRAEQAAIGTE